jgi:hypothetical protein
MMIRNQRKYGSVGIIAQINAQSYFCKDNYFKVEKFMYQFLLKIYY